MNPEPSSAVDLGGLGGGMTSACGASAHPVTYVDLTCEARDLLERVLAGLTTAHLTDRAAVGDLTAAHADLTSALGQLGRTVILGGQSEATTVGRGGAATLVRRLERLGRTRSWDEPPATGPSVAIDLQRAAQLLRAAAELWATHHMTSGAPRSPEASRLRHPATLGAATRQWQSLVRMAADISGALPNQSARYPRPARSRGDSALGALTIGLARSGPARSADPQVHLDLVVDRVRTTTWMMAQNCEASGPVLATTAAMAALLHLASARAHHRAACLAGHDAARDHHQAEAARHEECHERWQMVITLLSCVRTAHPASTAMQFERRHLSRLLPALERRPTGQGPAELADALSRAAARMDQIARFHARSISAGYERGLLYVTGRSLPSDLLVRRPDLLAAKLADRPVPAPTLMVERLLGAYAALTTPGETKTDEQMMTESMPQRETTPPAA